MNPRLRILLASAALAASCVVGVTARAQQDPASAVAAGSITPININIRDPRLSRAEANAMTGGASAIFNRLLASPALASPKGFSIHRTIVIGTPPAAMPASAPSTARGTILLLAINIPQGSRRDASGAYNGVGEGPTIQFTINDPTALFAFGDEQKPFYELTTTPGERGGFPVLRFRSRDHVIIAKAGRKPWRHVTKAELLQHEIADLRATVAKLGGNAAPVLLQSLSGQEAELAALSPDERNQPACQDGGRKNGSFVPCNTRGAHFVVTPDPAYFDRAAPRSSIQLITLSAPTTGGVGHKVLEPIARSAVEQLDLSALQALLD